jgi:hypothetical protein
MAKRHHSSHHSSHHSKMDGHKFSHPHEGHYEGMEGRRTQEAEDGGMIREHPHAIANLPQEVMIKAYPRTGPMMPESLDDTISGVDRQMDYDDSQRRKNFYPKKV